MRAALDTALLTCWALLAVLLALWTLHSVFPETQGWLEMAGDGAVLALPLLSAYRVQCAYRVPRPWFWATGCWAFALLTLAATRSAEARVVNWPLHQDALVAASMLFMLVAVPMTRVWRELFSALGRRTKRE